MPATPLPTLTPLLEKLQRRSILTTEESDALLAIPYRTSVLHPGAYLFRDGDVPQNCSVLLSGSVYRQKVSRDGARQILAVQFAGDLLGLDQSSLHVCDYSIQSLSHAEVAFVSHRAIIDVLSAFPNIAAALWRESFIEASIAREWFVNIARRSALGRVAHLICELAVRQDAAMLDDRRIDWPLTQEQLGDATGLTPVHINRTLQAMRATGLISSERHVLTILDWAALRDAGDFNPAYLHLPAARAENL